MLFREGSVSEGGKSGSLNRVGRAIRSTFGGSRGGLINVTRIVPIKLGGQEGVAPAITASAAELNCDKILRFREISGARDQP